MGGAGRDPFYERSKVLVAVLLRLADENAMLAPISTCDSLSATVEMELHEDVLRFFATDITYLIGSSRRLPSIRFNGRTHVAWVVSTLD